MTRDPNVDLLNGIYCLFSDNVICAQTWGFYLFGGDFQDEVELRHKCGVIWLVSLLDSLEGETRTVAEYEQQARERGLPHLLRICTQARVFFRRVEGVLALYSRQEQFFLSALRDQWVHSWLRKRHQARFTVRHFDGKALVSEQIEHATYHDLVRPFFEHPGGLDACLAPIIGRALRGELPYWRSVHALKACLDDLQAAMIEGRPFTVPTLEA